MTPEKRKIIQSKLNEFLSMSPEEKHTIDENQKLDGLFDIIQEMSDIVEENQQLEKERNWLICATGLGYFTHTDKTFNEILQVVKENTK